MNPNRILFPLTRKSRLGFTLVELLIAMALIILMLSIMSQAFVIATGTMQGLKEVADMQEKIRPAITLLQRDLGANHFEGSKKLSDPEFWDNGPPKEGYFMLWQDQPRDVAEGATNNVTFSQSAALANHMLAFTVKLPGKSPNDFFESSFGGAFGNLFFNGVGTPLGMTDSNIRRFESNANLIHSDWAEVAYFLGIQNTPVTDRTDGKSAPSLPYFNLYRQQKMVLPNFNIPITGVVLPAINAAIKEEISCETLTGTFNKPSDLTVPWKRMGNRTLNHLGNRAGPLFSEFPNTSTKVNTDIIATNVISFDVKVLTDLRYDYEDLATILSQGSYSAYPPFTNYAIANGNAAIRVFDTWTTDQGISSNPAVPKYDFGYWNNITGKWQPSGNTAGNNSLIPVWNATNNTGLNIKAVQISLRVWDQKSNTAKMFVVVQKL
jgi:type II secretory pathway pseudopilin PulG